MRAVKPFRLMLLPICPPSAPPSVTPGTLRSASDSDAAPWLCSSALLSTVTDCGTSRRSAGSLFSELSFFVKALELCPAISTSCTPMTAVAAPGAAAAAALPTAAEALLVLAVCDQAGAAAVNASSAEAIGVRRFISCC